MIGQTMEQVRSGLRSAEYSSEDVVQALLETMETRDAEIGAFLEWDAEAALQAARESDRRYADGAPRELEGIPIALKDVLNVQGQSCRCASRILEGYTSPYTATAVQNLMDAGAVILGRLNMDEFAMGSSCENSALKKTANPWDTGRVPGGSSGGSTAAVAARTALVSLGTDTGGSIRQPAAFCGVVGLKPTYGRVSRYGLTAYASSLDQIGPITRSVTDAARLLEVMSGPDGKDSTCLDHPVPAYTQKLDGGVAGLTIGIPREYYGEGIESSVREAVEASRKQFEEMGATTCEVDMPHTQYAIAVYYIIATAEASSNLARFEGVRYGARQDGEDPIDMMQRTREEGFGPEVKRRIMLGTYVLSSGYYDAYYLRAQKIRTLIRRDFEAAFKGCDVLLTPTTPTTAFPFGAKTDDPLQMYLNDIFTVTANLAGICAISQPCGFDRQGLPIGHQLIGPAMGEETLLRVAHAYESATDWHQRSPGAEVGA